MGRLGVRYAKLPIYQSTNLLIRNTPRSACKNHVFSTIFLVVFVDILGFSLILPLLPFYAETFGATPTVVGCWWPPTRWRSSSARRCWAASPTATAGGRPAGQHRGHGVASCCWASPTPSARLIGGDEPGGHRGALLQPHPRRPDGRQHLAGAGLHHRRDRRQEPGKALGMIGAAFGLGFIIGPALGGVLSQGAMPCRRWPPPGWRPLNCWPSSSCCPSR